MEGVSVKEERKKVFSEAGEWKTPIKGISSGHPSTTTVFGPIKKNPVKGTGSSHNPTFKPIKKNPVKGTGSGKRPATVVGPIKKNSKSFKISVETDPLLEESSRHEIEAEAIPVPDDTVAVDISSDDDEEVIETLTLRVIDGSKRWEILHYLVPASLFALNTSLLLVTTASTANVSIGNILALVLANLIAGLCILRNFIGRVFKKHKNKLMVEISGWEVEQVNLRDIMHYVPPFTLIILSFLFFGMVPPLVYAFTFRDTNDKNLKLAAAMGASLISTILFIFLPKIMYLNKLSNWLVCVKALAYVVCFQVVGFGLSYIGGYLLGKLVEKLDWFE